MRKARITLQFIGEIAKAVCLILPYGIWMAGQEIADAWVCTRERGGG